MNTSSSLKLAAPPPAVVIGDPRVTSLSSSSSDSSSSSLSSSSSDSSSSVMIATIVIGTALVVFISIYILLRLISKHHRNGYGYYNADDVVSRHRRHVVVRDPKARHVARRDLLDSLPLFTFGSVKRNLNGNGGGGDCAVCLSKFQPHHQLRLLPLCCHAFHAFCIDRWIVSNQTCPLCRSAVLPSDSDKILHAESDGSTNGDSFRIELGSISRRLEGSPAAAEGEVRRTYSLGSFDFIVDDCVHEISAGSTIIHCRGFSDSSIGIRELEVEPRVGVSASASAGEQMNWLEEYMDRMSSISSRTTSFRSFFSGSSLRTEPAVVPPNQDLEASRAGEEISEVFRWISGV